jgi:hypothetical protein
VDVRNVVPLAQLVKLHDGGERGLVNFVEASHFGLLS